MFAVPVTFTGDPSLTFTNVTASTNEDGYAQATVTLGQAPGTYPVTLTAGSESSTIASTTFSLRDPRRRPIGPTNGPNQMTIINGNGQLYRAQNPNFGATSALTVRLLGTDGITPVVNANVTFAVVGPQVAVVDNPNATTDANGMASTDFFPQSIPQNVGFVATTVTAVATQGAVTFNETVWQPDSNDGPVSATILQPTGTQVINAGEGDVVPGAIVGVVSLYAFGTSNQIPNVAMTITNPDGSGSPGPATCQRAS